MHRLWVWKEVQDTIFVVLSGVKPQLMDLVVYDYDYARKKKQKLDATKHHEGEQWTS